MPQLTATEARDLARSFHRMATNLGAFRFAHWDDIAPAARDRLAAMEWSLLTDASDMTTRAMILTVDDMSAALAAIRGATARLDAAVDHLRSTHDAIALATAAAMLGGAIVSGNALAIGSAVSAVANAIANITG